MLRIRVPPSKWRLICFLHPNSPRTQTPIYICVLLTTAAVLLLNWSRRVNVLLNHVRWRKFTYQRILWQVELQQNRAKEEQKALFKIPLWMVSIYTEWWVTAAGWLVGWLTDWLDCLSSVWLTLGKVYLLGQRTGWWPGKNLSGEWETGNECLFS